MSAAKRVVLVVDDDFDIRDTLADILSDAGYAAAFASDGFEALSWLRANPAPALILLDWMMPNCDGATFRAKQREDPAISGIPVVLLTADVRIGEKTRQIDAAAYLKKPVQLATLLETVERYAAPS